MNINLQHLTQKSIQYSARNVLLDFHNVVSQLNSGEILTLNYLINQYLFYGHDMHEAQETIATAIGRSRQHTNIVIKNLVSKGLLTVVDRHRGQYNNDSLQYVPSKYLFKFKFYFYTTFSALRKASWMTLQKLDLLGDFSWFKNPGLMGNLTPYKKIFISKPCKSLYQLLENTQGVCSRGMTKLKNKLKERNIEVDEAGGLLISPTLRDITEKLRLTKLGQLKLMSFSDDVLRIVWGSYRSAKNVKSPFDWMVVGCEQYSVANKIPVDWQIFYALLKRYRVEDNKSYIRKQETSKIATNITSGQASVPAWKKFLGMTPHPEFAQYFQQKVINDGL